MARIRGMLFDNDGTLVDTYDLILASFRHSTKAVLGKELPEEVLMEGVGTPLATQMQGFTDDPALQQRLLESYREHNHRVHDQVIALFPDVLEGLKRLHNAGIRMGVVTAKMHDLAWRGLEITGAAPYMDCLIGADDCARSKPDPAPILAGADALGLNPVECLYVGDSPYDIQAGNAAGCPTVAVLWGMFSRDVLEKQRPTFTITRFDELYELAEARS